MLWCITYWQDRMWSSLSSLWQVLYTCYGHSSWNYSSPRSKTSPLNHLTYHCPLSKLVRQWLSHLHTFGTALTWTLLLPVWKAFTSTRNQMYASDTSRNPFQSCLVFHSIVDLFLFEQTLTHPMTLFYHIWVKTESKGTWTEEVRNA